MNRKALPTIVVSSIAGFLGACSLAPTYKPPATEAVTSYKEAGDWMPAEARSMRNNVAPGSNT